MGSEKRVALLLSMLIGLWAAPAQADDLQARQLFERGVTLFEQGDFSAARDSFEAAAKLVSQPVVLYDLGLCYAELGDPIRAVRTMEQVLAAPGTLKPERIEQAKKTLEAQRKKLARLTLRSTPAGAEVRVGGVLLGRTPIVDVAVPAGTAHIELTLDGHALLRKTQTLSAERAHELELVLEPSDKKLARVMVRSELLAADIAIDGLVVARTPIGVSLGIEPGTHRVEVRRPGYVTAGETLVLAEGATGEVTLNPVPDAQASPSVMSTLALAVEPPDVSTFVDGARREVSPRGTSLAAGLHVVRLERSGYEPIQLRLDLPPGEVVSKTVALRPNPELRAQWIAEAHRARVGGWLSIAFGGGLAVAGVSVLSWNGTGKQALDQEDADSQAQRGDYAVCGSGDEVEAELCKDRRTGLGSRQNLALGLDVGGSIGLALGLGAVVIGSVLVGTAKDTSGLEQKPAEPWATLVPLVALGSDAFVLGLAGPF